MKKIKINLDQEILILTGMIVSNRILRLIRPNYKRNFFKSSINQRIAKWVIDYHDEFKKAPNVHIQDIFESKIESGNLDEDQVEMIGNVLNRLSNEFDRTDKFNEDYVLKKTELYFEKRRMEAVNTNVQDLLESNNIEEAEALLNGYQSSIFSNQQQVCDPLANEDLIERVFEELDKPLFKLPGALGEFIGDELQRENLIGLMGQEKIGKTWNLLEFAIQSARQRCNTIIFQAGDMSEKKLAARLFVRLSKKPLKKKHTGEKLFPVLDCKFNQNDECENKKRKGDIGLPDIKTQEDFENIFKNNRLDLIFKEAEEDEYVPCGVCKNEFHFDGSVWYEKRIIKRLRQNEVIEKTKKFKSWMRGKNFRFVTYPNDHLTIDLIKSHLDYFIHGEGFLPDTVIVDYADLLSASGSDIHEERSKQNYIWKNLRAISQIYNCLLITATQADANAYTSNSLSMNNFSEDKRKYAHATSMYSLNQTKWEKKAGIVRYGQLVVREDETEPYRQVKVLQHLSTGQTWVSSFF